MLLRRLSVFAGGWTLETADARYAVYTRDDFETLDALSGLVDKSLVFADDDEMGGRRFRMLETVRQYGQDRLRDSGEYSDVRDRHLACFCRLAGAARHELKGPDQSMWLRRLRREHDNLAVALGWSEAAADGADASLELSAGLHLFWFKHGHLNEARRWLKPRSLAPASRP